MKKNRISLRLISVLMLMCMLFMCIPVTAVALSDSLGIAITEEHATELTELFTTTANAKEYASKEHVVDVQLGQTLRLSVVGVTERSYDVKWSSSNSTVALVDANGVVKALKSGVATIKATSGTLTAEIKINVVKNIMIVTNSSKVTVGNLCNFDLNIGGDLNKYIYDVEWLVSNEGYAQVGDGLVLAQKPGVVSVIARVNDKLNKTLVSESSCTVTILSKISSMSISNKVTELEFGKTHKLDITTTPQGYDIFWTTSNKDICSVDENGVIKGNGLGRATITAYAGEWDNGKLIQTKKVLDSFTVEVWSPSSRLYKATLGNNYNGKVTISKTNAYSGELITIYAENTTEVKTEYVETKGVTVVSVTDEGGRTVNVTKVKDGVYTFIMPASNVSINPVYSTLYTVTYATSLPANFSRDNNLVGRITVDEYVGGTFNGTYNFNSDIDLSRAEVNISGQKKEVIGNAGTVTVKVSGNRGNGSKIEILIYSDGQSVANGSHSIDISGGIKANIYNSFIAYNVGNIRPDALEVTPQYIEQNLYGTILRMKAGTQVVIHGESWEIIKDKNITLIFEFTSGTLEIPGASLQSITMSSGDFVSFDFVVDAAVFSEKNVFGTGKLTIRTFTSTGLTQDDLSLIGKSVLTLTNPDNKSLSIETNVGTLESIENSKFNLNSLSDMNNFTIYMRGSIINGDVLFIVIVILLILGLGFAGTRLVKKLRNIKDDEPPKHDPPHVPTKFEPEPVHEGDKEPEPSNYSLEEDVKPFRSVDDILRDSNLDAEAAAIHELAIEELKKEIARKITEYVLAENILLDENQVSELRFNMSSLFIEADEFENKHTALKTTMYNSNITYNKAIQIVDNTAISAEEVHSITDELRNNINELVFARNAYELYLPVLNNQIEELCTKLAILKELKAQLLKTIQEANDLINFYERCRPEFKSAIEAVEASGNTEALNDNKERFETIESEYSAAKIIIDSATIFADGINPSTPKEEIEGWINKVEDAKFEFGDVVPRTDELKTVLSDLAAKVEQEKIQKHQELINEFDILIDTIKTMVETYKSKLEELNTLNDNRYDDVNLQLKELTSVDEVDELIEVQPMDNIDELSAHVGKLKVVSDGLIKDIEDVCNLIELVKSRDAELKKNFDAYNDLLNILPVIKDEAMEAISSADEENELIFNEELNDNIGKTIGALNDVATYFSEEVNNDNIVEKVRVGIDKINVLRDRVQVLNALVVSAKASRQAAEEEAARIAAEEEAKRLAEEEAARIAAEEEAKRLAEEEAARIAAEEEAKRIAEEEAARIAAEEEAKRLAEEEAARIAAEEEAKRIERRKELLSTLEILIDKEKSEYAATVECLRNVEKMSDVSKKELHDYIESTHDNFAKTCLELDNLSNPQLTDLIEAIEDDLENLVVMRSSLDKIDSFPELKPTKLSRKRLKYWQGQLNSTNPYMAYVANARVTAHKLRVRAIVQSRKENEMRQKAHKKK